VAIDGTYAIPPATLMGPKVAGANLRLGDPLSLRDTEAARKAIVEYYRDEGYYFVSVRVTFEYSTDKSHARIRFLVSEGEQVVIDKIYVEGEKLTRESLILDRLLIKEGGIYRARLVRESSERLAKLGVFQSISIGLVNPTIPGKRKSVVVSVRERPQQHLEYRFGYSTGEGLRFYGEYGVANLFGYAVSYDIRIRLSYQPFIGASCGRHDGDPCSGGGLYDSTVVRRWVQQTNGLERWPRRISTGFSFPHTPLLGADVRTTIELINVLDLRRDFVGDKYILPALTMTYTPWQPLTMIFGTGVELNNFKIFDEKNTTLNNVIASNPALASFLRVPTGNTGVFAFNVTSMFDFRDNRLGATKNGYVSLSWEYVRSFKNATDPDTRQDVRSEFLHVTSGAGTYYQMKFLPKKPVLALELRGGGNFNVLSCGGTENTKQGASGTSAYCDTYPDRLFYLGGFESTRGFYPGTMLPQDSIDDLLNNPAVDQSQLGVLAARGGNVFINPRAELRIPAFKWGGFVAFVDAANTWRDKSRFQPWKLRYSVGPGLSIDTPVGPVALDLGFNLSRYSQFGEPLMVFNFSIGRF
jgi:outer membrane protein assembly factor BamA